MLNLYYPPDVSDDNYDELQRRHGTVYESNGYRYVIAWGKGQIAYKLAISEENVKGIFRGLDKVGRELFPKPPKAKQTPEFLAWAAEQRAKREAGRDHTQSGDTTF